MLTPKYAAERFYFNDDKTDIVSASSEFPTKINPMIAKKVEEEKIEFVGEMSILSVK